MERAGVQTAGLVLVIFDVVGFMVVKAQASIAVAWLHISLNLEMPIFMSSFPNNLA